VRRGAAIGGGARVSELIGTGGSGVDRTALAEMLTTELASTERVRIGLAETVFAGED